MPYKDPEKSREQQRRWRAENPERAREMRRRYYNKPEVRARYRDVYRKRSVQDEDEKRERATSRRQQLKLEMVLLKGGVCLDCGMSLVEFPECADFDHVRDEKKFILSTVTSSCVYTRTVDEVLDELEKCDLVCANCHRKRTKQQWKEKYLHATCVGS